MTDALEYIRRIQTQRGLLDAIREVQLYKANAFYPGELDAIKRRAHAIGGAGLRDVLQAIEGARG